MTRTAVSGEPVTTVTMVVTAATIPKAAMLQALIDAEATAQIGAAPHERSETLNRPGSVEALGCRLVFGEAAT